MARINDEKLKMMEDEMTRFEAEIALPVIPPSLPGVAAPRPVIGASTYNQVQRQLEEQQSGVIPPEFAAMGPAVAFPPLIPAMQPYGLPPPPPPPPPVFIPHQVQRPGPVRPPMRPPMALGPPMMPGPAPPPPAFMGPPQPGPPPFMAPMVTIQQVGQPVLSGAALIYNPKNLTGDASNAVHTQEERDDNVDKRAVKKKPVVIPDKPAEPIVRAKDMAEKVKATTTVSITPNSEEVVPPTTKKKEKKNKKPIRTAGGQIWEDHSLLEWEDDDFRIFCGDLGNDVTDEILSRAFGKYQSFLKAKVVRDKRTNKTKGYGFVSFKDPQDFIKAMKEMNGRYVGSRPIKLRKSCWKSRNLDSVRKKEKEKAALVGLLTGR